MAVRDHSQVGISENIERVEMLICSHETALHVYKNLYEIEREMDISRSSVRRIAKDDIQLKIYLSAGQGYCDSIDGTTLFSKVVSNKLRYYVKDEITLICANLVPTWSILLKLQAVKQRGPFLAHHS